MNIQIIQLRDSQPSVAQIVEGVLCWGEVVKAIHSKGATALSFHSLGLALFSGFFEVGDLVIGSHNHYLPALLLKLSNLTIAEFRAPFES